MTYKPASLTLCGQPINGPRVWDYGDTGSGVANVVGSGFFTDGASKGMKVGDQVTFRDLTATINYGLRVSAVSDTGSTQVTTDGQVVIGDTS